MVKRLQKVDANDVKSTNQGTSAMWGKAKHLVIPSGTRLIFEEDSDAILCFLGVKDISDKVGKESGEVIYQTFTDGKRIVAMPNSYSLSQVTFTPEKFYYLHCVNKIPMSNKGFNEMKNFAIYELGSEGETIASDENRTGSKEITLTLPVIAELNYSKLNYPLR